MTATPSQPPVLVSACLAGRRCRHDGRNRTRADIAALVAAGGAIPVCPEEEGGLGTPRDRAELRGGDGAAVLDGRARVVSERGVDVTPQFLDGAARALAVARDAGAVRAILTARSPSCGHGQVWCEGAVIEGDGVTAALLRREGLEVDACE